MLMSSLVETRAVPEGRHGPTSARIYSTEGLLPRTAAIATHPLLKPRHQQPSCPGLALCVLAHTAAASTSFSSPTPLHCPLHASALPVLDAHPFSLACASDEARLCWIWSSAVAPRPASFGQSICYLVAPPNGLLHGLRLHSSTTFFDYFILNSPRRAATAVASHHGDFLITTSRLTAALMTTTSTRTTTASRF